MMIYLPLNHKNLLIDILLNIVLMKLWYTGVKIMINHISIKITIINMTKDQRKMFPNGLLIKEIMKK
jgi:hypothetical protein